MALLEQATGARFTHAPFKGDAEALNSLMAGHIKSGVYANTVLPYLSSGKLRALASARSEEHTSELQSQSNLVCRLLLEKKKKTLSRIDYAVAAKVVDHRSHETLGEVVVELQGMQGPNPGLPDLEHHVRCYQHKPDADGL